MYEEVGELDFPALEREVLRFWDERQIFDKLRRKNAGGPAFSFFDGPITANNPRGLGVHHAWGRTYKDAFQRYKAMCGFDQRYQNGFDCQGLWVEVEVEKELGLNGKGDIAAYGLDRFATACKERVARSAAAVTQNSRRLGQWMDWDHSYYTHADSNVEHIWHFLKTCHERDWLYKGHRVMPWCFRCGTSLSQHEMADSYRDVVHKAVYVQWPLLDRPGEKILVWTTTPWTLCANTALAVHPELDYVCVDGLWMGALAARRIAADKRIDKRCKGTQLLGWRYAGAFDDLAAQTSVERRVVPWSEISENEGSGVVHIAPACGADDCELGRERALDVVEPLGEDGCYLEGFGEWTGRRCDEVAEDMVGHLRALGLLYREEKYEHRYPHCWRCGGELVYRLVDEWFIASDELRPHLIQAAQEVRWVPDHAGKRMLDWLRNMDDWCISRKRYWGLPLPIYETANGEWIAVGSRAELRRLAVDPRRVDALPELHRPWIDAIELRLSSGQRARRISEVGDCWLDAGIVPFSTLGYSDGQNGAWSKWYPADFAVEMREQIRLWFYSMLFMGVTLSGRAPYRTVMCYEKMRDAEGRPMHKSAGNALWFDEAVEASGADPMRWSFAGQNLSTDMRYGTENLREVKRRFLTLWNTYRFYVQYANLDADQLVLQQPKWAWVDRWLLARLQEVVARVQRGFETWDLPPAVREIECFIDELSNWYLRLNRRRFWRDGDIADKAAAHEALYRALKTLSLLLAPIMPFSSEKIYQNLVRKREDNAPESVHLCSYPTIDEQWVDKSLLASMETLQKAIVCGRALRRQADIKVRQPLQRLVFDVSDSAWPELEKRAELICSELNIKEVARGQRGDWSRRKIRANLRVLGPRWGRRLPALMQVLAATDGDLLADKLEKTGRCTIDLEGKQVELCSSDLLVDEVPRPGWSVCEDGPWAAALQTTLDESLRNEGLAREFSHGVQSLRRELNLALDDRIRLRVAAPDWLACALSAHASYICTETLCEELEFGAVKDSPSLSVGDASVEVELCVITR